MNTEHGTRNTDRAAAAWALGAVLALMPAVASAQITTDPTRPATGFAAEVQEGAAAAAGNQLQSVMISPTQSAAIINGVRVALGEKYGDAVLVRVAESEVVLKSGSEQQVLKLHPGVDKKVQLVRAEPAAPAAKSGPRQAKTQPVSRAKPKAKANPKAKAKTSRETSPAADGGARER
ncbi:MAG: hypothetical protein ACRET7_03215 [Burkholderiales bacterium]